MAKNLARLWREKCRPAAKPAFSQRSAALSFIGGFMLSLTPPSQAIAQSQQSDLVVTAVNWDNSSPQPGSPLTFSALVKNQGTVATGGTWIGVLFTVDGQPVSWGSNGGVSLAPGASILLTANGAPTGPPVWIASTGLHSIVANVDDVNRIPESNEANNIMSGSLLVANAPPSLPDLVVTGITWDNTNPQVGSLEKFSVTVKNQGTATTNGIGIGVLFSVDGQQVSWTDNPNAVLAPGVSVTFAANGGASGSSTWIATAGSHTVTASVDDINRIAESNEINNTLSQPFSVSGRTQPDLIITAVSWDPANPQPGCSVTFSATVKNQGTAATDGTWIGVLFLIDGQPFTWGSNGGATLAAGASVTLVANSGPTGSSTWIATAGIHTLLTTVDSPNRIPESNETNNQFTKGITILSPAPPLSSFLWEGRFDFTDASSPVVIWQGSRIGLDFEGDTLSLRFDGVYGQAFFNVTIDGQTSILQLRENVPPQGADFSNLGAGRHQLRILKRSEATAGSAHFRGVQLTPNAQYWTPAAPSYKLRMLFFGDSITVGACNEDGPADQWDNYLTHDNALSYAALTAAAFSADYQNRAISGMGVSEGWTDVKAYEVWNRLYPYRNTQLDNPVAPSPHVIFLNLGENDDSYTRAFNRPFPVSFADNYIILVQALRSAWPQAQIVLLRGGMSGGAQSGPLIQAWEQAVSSLRATDSKISRFVFQHWTWSHPRVADDIIMANELNEWLRQQPFMLSYR